MSHNSDYCAPGVIDKKHACFSLASLKRMAQAINKRNAKAKRGVRRIPVNTNKELLVKNITPHLADQCSTQLCWISHPIISSIENDEIVKRTFKESQPTDSDRLRTSKLQAIMKQFEEKYHDFVFFGPVPLNFKSFSTELNNIQIRKLYKNGIRHIGVIFNTKPIPHNGEHWICAHIHLDSNMPIISYFDSYAFPPPKEIIEFLDSVEYKIANMIPKKTLHPIRKINVYQHQQRGDECGVYCMYFILESVKGRSFEDITSKIVRDNQMKMKRDIYMLPKSAH